MIPDCVQWRLMANWFGWWRDVAATSEALELTFLGHAGRDRSRSRRHQRHSALLIAHKDARIMIDCGADWLGRLHAISPTAIVLTHAHLDHAGGLAQDAPCPVYATKETLRLLRRFQFVIDAIYSWRDQ